MSAFQPFILFEAHRSQVAAFETCESLCNPPSPHRHPASFSTSSPNPGSNPYWRSPPPSHQASPISPQPCAAWDQLVPSVSPATPVASHQNHQSSPCSPCSPPVLAFNHHLFKPCPSIDYSPDYMSSISLLFPPSPVYPAPSPVYPAPSPVYPAPSPVYHPPHKPDVITNLSPNTERWFQNLAKLPQPLPNVSPFLSFHF